MSQQTPWITDPLLRVTTPSPPSFMHPAPLAFDHRRAAATCPRIRLAPQFRQNPAQQRRRTAVRRAGVAARQNGRDRCHPQSPEPVHGSSANRWRMRGRPFPGPPARERQAVPPAQTSTDCRCPPPTTKPALARPQASRTVPRAVCGHCWRPMHRRARHRAPRPCCALAHSLLFPRRQPTRWAPPSP